MNAKRNFNLPLVVHSTVTSHMPYSSIEIPTISFECTAFQRNGMNVKLAQGLDREDIVVVLVSSPAT